MAPRSSGILLHLTSLPSDHGIGDMGRGAYDFVDFLDDSGQSIWQVLPIGPSSGFCGNSPYSGFSVFAGNPLLISLDLLVEDGLLTRGEIETRHPFASRFVDYEAVEPFKSALLRRAFEKYRERAGADAEFQRFCAENAGWLDDYALFTSIKERLSGAGWSDWPDGLKNREEAALRKAGEELAESVLREKFCQYVFFRQWTSLKAYCKSKGVRIFGDIPIYVSHDSADVWANPEVFKLDARKRPAFVAGVPPDYFSKTGQLWGNPVYCWETLKETDFGWWVKRMAWNLRLFDLARLDHFRGFVAYWEVAAVEKTAQNGRWVDAPARALFDTLLRRFPRLPLVAEDLGTITPDVRAIIRHYGFPGMKILQFAFGGGGASNPYVPHNHVRNCIVYTGTHDNNTTRGWFAHDASSVEKQSLFRYLGRTIEEDRAHEELIRLAMMSVCDTAIIPMQDHLGLGGDARMNLPAVAFGNWAWRLEAESLTPALAASILEVTETCGRTPGQGMTDFDTQPSGTRSSETV
ncbi:MAG TPA: 4-alpha-glucanotransferase [Syntrophobacter fumaroxidans]|nr:4-alpha-glucanotransferase [Syntrophobacter fumaroxidans]